MHLELLLALARGQTPIEATAANVYKLRGRFYGNLSSSGYPFPRGTLLSAWHLILKGGPRDTLP